MSEHPTSNPRQHTEIEVDPRYIADPGDGPCGRKREVPHLVPEAYPDIDFEKVEATAARLAETKSDSEAISQVFGESVQIVHQREL